MTGHLWELLAAVGLWFWVNVAGNLVASLLWALPALAWHHRRMRRHVVAEHDRLYSDLADLAPAPAPTPEPDPATSPVPIDTTALARAVRVADQRAAERGTTRL